jgi:uncharacterized membrane protein
MQKTIWTPLFIAKSALIAALYVAVTGLLAPFSFGSVQVRVADALVILAFYSQSAIYGLTAGCLLANILWSPFGILDVLFGTLATFIGVWLAYSLRKNRPVALLPTVIANAIFVPLILIWAGGDKNSYLLLSFYIAISQVIACYAIGWPLSKLMDKYSNKIFKNGGEA